MQGSKSLPRTVRGRNSLYFYSILLVPLMVPQGCRTDPLRERYRIPPISWVRDLFRGYRLSHEDLGSTHVSVLSVIDWERYRAEFQPQYELTPETALAQAVPDTLQVEDSLLRAFQARFGLKLSKSSALPAGFQPGGAGQDDLWPPANEGSNGDATENTAIDKQNLKTDATLQYLAATALFQEVKLLNRYLLNASI